MKVLVEEVKGERVPAYSRDLRIFVVLEGSFRVYLTKKGKDIYRVDPMGKHDCLRTTPNFIVGFRGNGKLLVVLMGEEEFLNWGYFERLRNVYED